MPKANLFLDNRALSLAELNHLALSAMSSWIIIVASAALFGLPACLAWDPPPPERLTSALAPVEIGWIVGHSVGDGCGVILKTTDGGQNWTRQGSAWDVPDVNLYVVWAADASYAWAVGSNTDGYGLIIPKMAGAPGIPRRCP